MFDADILRSGSLHNRVIHQAQVYKIPSLKRHFEFKKINVFPFGKHDNFEIEAKVVV